MLAIIFIKVLSSNRWWHHVFYSQSRGVGVGKCPEYLNLELKVIYIHLWLQRSLPYLNFIFIIDSITIKRYPLNFYQITHPGLFTTVWLFLIWRCPWVFPCSQAKPKTSKVFKVWLAGSWWNVICITYLPEFPWTRTQKLFPVKVTQNQLVVSSCTKNQILNKAPQK